MPGLRHCCACLQLAVIRFDFKCEAYVRDRVFVPAVDLRRIGQCRETIERVEHLCRSALEQAAAAGAEQRVAAEERAVTGIGDVAERVSGNCHHVEVEPEVFEQVAEVRVANMVDPLYTVVAKFPKRLLPARVAEPAPR